MVADGCGATAVVGAGDEIAAGGVSAVGGGFDEAIVGNWARSLRSRGGGEGWRGCFPRFVGMLGERQGGRGHPPEYVPDWLDSPSSSTGSSRSCP